MDIGFEVEKILREQGITAPAMSNEEFMAKLNGKLEVMIPRKVIEVIRTASSEVVDEEMKRLGREEPCRFFSKGKCRKGLDVKQCLECLSYKPERQWLKWVKNLYKKSPERFEWGIIGLGTLTLVMALIAPELQLWTVIFWFVLFVISRVQVILQWGLIRILNRGMLSWLKEAK